MTKPVAIALGVATSLLWSTVFAGSVPVPGLGGQVMIEVESFQERRFSSVLPQEYDFSCGSAALASLLSFHYDHDTNEQEVFASMLALADANKVRQEGFSMLDMKRYLASEGYQADGFRMPLEDLREKIRLPLIVLVTLDGYRHFVVIKGISREEVLIGDPARGLRVYAHAEFENYWDGTAFVIRSHLEQGRRQFLATADEWPEVARAPLQQGQTSPSLGQTLPYWPSLREW